LREREEECTANIRNPERQLTNDKEENDTCRKERQSKTRTEKKIERERVREGEKKRRNTLPFWTFGICGMYRTVKKGRAR
jgi:hypothetical protein